jgi:hypothetical protein
VARINYYKQVEACDRTNIIVGLCGASGDTLQWVLLLVYVGPQATHFTGYYCWFMWGLGQHTSMGIVVGLCGGLRQHT